MCTPPVNDNFWIIPSMRLLIHRRYDLGGRVHGAGFDTVMLVSVLLALIGFAFMRTWSGHVIGLVSLEIWRIIRISKNNRSYMLQPLMVACAPSFVGSMVAQLVWMLKQLAAETRRIQQRRAAQRRAQRKARGTLLTALRPVSQVGGVRRFDTICCSWLWKLRSLKRSKLNVFTHLVKPNPTQLFTPVFQLGDRCHFAKALIAFWIFERPRLLRHAQLQ